MKKGPQRPTIELICEQCGCTFLKELRLWRKYDHHFCSPQCSGANDRTSEEKTCTECKKPFLRSPSQTKRSALLFCSHSCNASYYNRLRKETRRSKMEEALFEMLVSRYPSLEIIANDKKVLDGFEMDIFIPSLNIGIEWNGIVHFKPIYGERKLNLTQTRDRLKMKIAARKGIDLIVIPDLTSTPDITQKAFEEVSGIIDQLLSENDVADDGEHDSHTCVRIP